jgi:predicted MPP superfamily phosphohydrolase
MFEAMFSPIFVPMLAAWATWASLASWFAWLVVVSCAGLFRSRAYAIFRGVMLGVYTLVALAVLPRTGPWALPALYLHLTVYLQALLLVWPRLRPLPYRLLVSLPGLYFGAAVLLAFPWAILRGLGFEPYGLWIPFALSLAGLVQSLSARTETRMITVGSGERVDGLKRLPIEPVRHDRGRPLRVVQITDPHLGPFMSVERLARICERAVAAQPDLVMLTGDYLTMESQGDARWLSQALRPLEKLEGRVFACFGNHDHEAPELVRSALASVGARLLVDDAAVVETEAGTVQVVGFDFTYRERAAHLSRVCEAHPRLPGVLRLALLHDPGAFRHLPEGEADLVLSGHTHGGQLGLVSLNLPWTIAGWVANIPDHGAWARGSDRLYVHRGTGHYGFPLRLGVPAEEGVLLVHFVAGVQGGATRP